jgi:hypothetical protein
MLHATPRGLFTWGFTIRQGEDTIADIDPSWLGERAEIRVEGQTYSAYRESLLAGTPRTRSVSPTRCSSNPPTPWLTR